MPIDTNIFKDILFFCLLPITILIGIAILYCFIKQKEKKRGNTARLTGKGKTHGRNKTK